MGIASNTYTTFVTIEYQSVATWDASARLDPCSLYSLFSLFTFPKHSLDSCPLSRCVCRVSISMVYCGWIYGAHEYMLHMSCINCKRKRSGMHSIQQVKQLLTFDSPALHAYTTQSTHLRPQSNSSVQPIYPGLIIQDTLEGQQNARSEIQPVIAHVQQPFFLQALADYSNNVTFKQVDWLSLGVWVWG